MALCVYRDVNIVVAVIVAMFGVGSWVAINGLWVELPIMVPHLPEGWQLPSYLVIISQIANIGPLIVTLLMVFGRKHVSDRIIIYVVVAIGTVASLLLAFFWDKTSHIAGRERSVALFVLQFFLAAVDCTSSVLYLPFMALFKPQYMVPYFIGEGLSGLIPSLVALGQGVGRMTCQNVSSINSTTNETTFGIVPIYHDPSFPAEHFFYFLTAMMALCGGAFTLLNYLPLCKREHVASDSYEVSKDDSSQDNPTTQAGQSQTKLIKAKEAGARNSSIKDVLSPKKPLSRQHYLYFLLLTVIINAIVNGTLPSVQTYSCLPYGNNIYHLAVTLSSIANPLACFGAFFLVVKSSLIVTLLTSTGLALAAFILFIAAESPNPILTGTTTGGGIAVTSWVLVYLILTFAKVSIAGALRANGKRALLWCGVCQQVGSFLGAIVMYVMVNVLEVFQSGPPC